MYFAFIKHGIIKVTIRNAYKELFREKNSLFDVDNLRGGQAALDSLPSP